MVPCRSLRFPFLLHGDREVSSLTQFILGLIAAFLLTCLPVSVQAQQKPGLSLDQAIDLALAHSHSLKASRTQIQQSQAQEITAALRPNPVLSWDSQFLPLFTPDAFSAENLSQLQQFDVGVGYVWERGRKRQRRIDAARDQTAVASSQVSDSERSVTFNVAQQYIAALLAKANIELAKENLKSFQQTVEIADYQYKAGQISENDSLKIRLQLLQFQSDMAASQLALTQAKGTLRQLIGYEAIPEDFDLDSDLKFEPVPVGLDQLQSRALVKRPDLRAAQLGIAASKSQHDLAIANGKRDLGTSFNYSHASGASSASIFFNIELPIFDRNQGEKARTEFAITQATETAAAVTDSVMSDIRNAFESVRVNEKIIQLYQSGYLKNSQDSRDISEYAYKKGAASLLDFLDAERNFRATQLSYRQALAAYMLALEQLKQATGSRRLQ